jgi:hypothetical protein
MLSKIFQDVKEALLLLHPEFVFKLGAIPMKSLGDSQDEDSTEGGASGYPNPAPILSLEMTEPSSTVPPLAVEMKHNAKRHDIDSEDEDEDEFDEVQQPGADANLHLRIDRESRGIGEVSSNDEEEAIFRQKRTESPILRVLQGAELVISNLAANIQTPKRAPSPKDSNQAVYDSLL